MYLGKSCQSKIKFFVIFILILFTSCADLEPIVVANDPAKAVWHSGPERFVQYNSSGDVVIHPFFDLLAFPNRVDSGINFFPLFNSSDSAFYDLDLYSGKMFLRHHFCPRSDIWKKDGQTITKSNFTYGIVPRLLDQVGMPQNIVVFGRSDFYSSLPKSILSSYRVRVIGGVLEQFCKDFPCSASNDWISRLVLIAVDMNDKKFKHITDFSSLKEVIDWDYAKTFLENLYGGSQIGVGIRPAYRVVGEIDAKRSLDTAVKKGHLFQFKEMRALKRGCHKLYDHIWSSAKKIRSGKGKYSGFAEFFSDFYSKYGNQYQNCSRLVSSASLNSNLDRFWFFAYLKAFFEMEHLGFVYHCSHMNWMRNPINPATGKNIYSNSKIYKMCHDRQLDNAFESAPTVLAGMSSSGSGYSKFIEYDTLPHGTHERLFSWTRWSGKKYFCHNRKKEDITSSIDIFPSDIAWKRFYKKKVINKSLMIK